MQYTLIDKRKSVGYLVLNRPDKRNALNFDFVKELQEQFTKLEADEDIRVIVIRAEGKAFCSGADLGYMQKLQDFTYVENLDDSNNLMILFHQIYTSSKPVISLVDGPALAGGCGLATICDFSFATPAATFGYTEARIGFVPAIVMVFLLRKVGDSMARELTLTGDIMNAENALSKGLINAIVDENDINNYVHEFAEKLAKQTSGASLAIIKEMISKMQDMPMDLALKYASEANANARETDDCKRGIAAFLNKEKIEWD